MFSDIHQKQREEVDPHDQLILGGDPGNHLEARHLEEEEGNKQGVEGSYVKKTKRYMMVLVNSVVMKVVRFLEVKNA